jgi:hypothetical protein
MIWMKFIAFSDYFFIVKREKLELNFILGRKGLGKMKTLCSRLFFENDL